MEDFSQIFQYIKNGKITEITKYFANGKNKEKINKQLGFNGTPLHYAISEDKKDIVQLLLDNGANVNSQIGPDGKGDTPLHYALKNNNIPIMEILLENGADVNVNSNLTNHKTPLQYAVSIGEKDIVELFLFEGSDVNLQQEDSYGTPLVSIAKNLKDENIANLIAKMLISYGFKEEDDKKKEERVQKIEKLKKKKKEAEELMAEYRTDIYKLTTQKHTELNNLVKELKEIPPLNITKEYNEFLKKVISLKEAEAEVIEKLKKAEAEVIEKLKKAKAEAQAEAEAKAKAEAEAAKKQSGGSYTNNRLLHKINKYEHKYYSLLLQQKKMRYLN